MLTRHFRLTPVLIGCVRHAQKCEPLSHECELTFIFLALALDVIQKCHWRSNRVEKSCEWKWNALVPREATWMKVQQPSGSQPYPYFLPESWTSAGNSFFSDVLTHKNNQERLVEIPFWIKLNYVLRNENQYTSLRPLSTIACTTVLVTGYTLQCIVYILWIHKISSIISKFPYGFYKFDHEVGTIYPYNVSKNVLSRCKGVTWSQFMARQNMTVVIMYL